MDGRLFVLKDEFARIQILPELVESYFDLDQIQQDTLFVKFDYDSLLMRIRRFYTAIEGDGDSVILSHEILDRKSIIKISNHEIFVEKIDSNMLLPLLKRLFRNAFVVEV